VHNIMLCICFYILLYIFMSEMLICVTKMLIYLSICSGFSLEPRLIIGDY
jgi:hypothetical protein